MQIFAVRYTLLHALLYRSTLCSLEHALLPCTLEPVQRLVEGANRIRLHGDGIVSEDVITTGYFRTQIVTQPASEPIESRRGPTRGGADKSIRARFEIPYIGEITIFWRVLLAEQNLRPYLEYVRFRDFKSQIGKVLCITPSLQSPSSSTVCN